MLILDMIGCVWCLSYYSFRPGGELMRGEDQIDGVKRLLNEVSACSVYDD